MGPLSSPAIAVLTIILNKAYETIGEKFGGALSDHIGKYISMLQSKKLSKIQELQEESELGSYSKAVEELDSAIQSDEEVADAVQKLTEAVKSDPTLIKIIQKFASSIEKIENEPETISHSNKFIGKVGVWVENGGVVKIRDFRM